MFQRRILFRFVLAEILGPAMIGLIVFTFILLINKLLKLVELLVNKGVSLGEVTQLLWYLLPSFLVLTIPISILLGILVCMGRLSGDCELIALKASGVSLYQFLPPVAFVCCLGFLLTSAITLYVLPLGNYAFRKSLVDIARKHSEANLEEGIFIDYFDGIVLYINSFNQDANRIDGIFISDRRDPKTPTIVVAAHALIFADRDNTNLSFHLSNGSIHRIEQQSSDYQYALFNAYTMNIQLAETDDDDFKIKYREMDTRSLLRLSEERRRNKQSAVNINLEIQKRFAFPFACLVFGLLGISLGGSWHRGGRSYGFVASLVIVFLYYLFLNIGENLAKGGFLYVWIGVWLPNLLLGGIGVYLFKKVAHEQPLPLAGIDIAALWLDRGAAIIKTLLRRALQDRRRQ
ncbi:MAG: LPS export ABC transporter permease LptF [Desulfobacterota bacterium]|nr:LPS export ABC transporter permease LptF [Thermodesulfobacteriota bacterium]